MANNAFAVAKEATERANEVVNRAAEVVNDLRRGVEQGYADFNKGVQRVKQNAEDKVLESKLKIRQKPLQSVAVVGGFGLLAGLVIGIFVGRKTRCD